MLARATESGWGNPMWDATDVQAGGVMPGEAQLLYGLVRALQPELILEVGTSHGYSTLHLAQAAKDNAHGKVHTVEINAARQADAIANIEAARLSKWVEFHHEIHADRYDLAFYDAAHELEDVEQYFSQTGEPPRTVIIHDAAWKGHAVEFAARHGYSMAMFKTSFAGLAILVRPFDFLIPG